jgi:Fe-S cluster biogenesis protein NfuA
MESKLNTTIMDASVDAKLKVELFGICNGCIYSPMCYRNHSLGESVFNAAKPYLSGKVKEISIRIDRECNDFKPVGRGI